MPKIPAYASPLNLLGHQLMENDRETPKTKWLSKKSKIDPRDLWTGPHCFALKYQIYLLLVAKKKNHNLDRLVTEGSSKKISEKAK